MITKEQFKKHLKWLNDEEGGERLVVEDADLIRANLRDANLGGADIRGANLIDANLRGANLIGANLRGAKLPSPTMILLANWIDVSDDLCINLMRFDASMHPNPEKFQAWASGGDCPYEDCKFQRAANFKQKRGDLPT